MQKIEKNIKEWKFLNKYLSKMSIERNNKSTMVLDYGCGKGRYLKTIADYGFKVIGVDKNYMRIKEHNDKGYDCYTPTIFKKLKYKYDMVLLSHIIEHCDISTFIDILEICMSKLKVNGYLVVFSPLESKYFWRTVDHIKPYHYSAIQQMINGKVECDFEGKYKIDLLEIRYYRKTYFIDWRNGGILFYFSRRIINSLSKVLFFLSFERFGIAERYCCVYKKEK